MSWVNQLGENILSDDVNKPGNDSDAENLSPAGRISRQGDELAARGSYAEAIAAYRESIEQDATIFSNYLKLAMAQYQNAEYLAAEATLQKMVDVGPADRRPYTYREIIRFYLSFLQWDKAREAAEKCIALGVKDANHFLAQSVLAISK